MGLASKLAQINQQSAAPGGALGGGAPAYNASTIPARSEDAGNYSFAGSSVPQQYPAPPQYGGYAPPQAPPPPNMSASGWPGQHPGGNNHQGGYPGQSAHPAPPPGARPPAGPPSGYPGAYPVVSGMPAASPQYPVSPTKQPGHAPPMANAHGQFGQAGIVESLRRCVRDNQLERFYPEQRLGQLAAQTVQLSSRLAALCRDWRMPTEMAYDLYKLALFDIVMLCDDSGSMMFEEGGERVRDLEMIISYIARAAALFDSDGISVRFLNSEVEADGIRDASQVQELIRRVKFNGLTPLGTVLDKKILQPFFYRELERNALNKPLLVLIVTDGVPAGEPRDRFEQVLRQVYRSSNNGCGIAISVAQVGTDMQAHGFLADLDKNREFGRMIDVTSNFEVEQEEMQRKGVDLTPELWVCKLLMGSIDPSYDEKDEM